MQRWTPQHAKFVGRVIFANFLNLPLKNYQSIIEEVERDFSILVPTTAGRVCDLSRFAGFPICGGKKKNGAAITVKRLSRARTLEEKKNASVAVVAKIENRLRRGYGVAGGRGTGRGNRFIIRYACEGFNRMYVIDNAVQDELCADKNIRSMIFRLRRIGSRNELTHAIIKGVIEHQGDFLSTGNPIDLVPLSQVDLTEWMNRMRSAERGLRPPATLCVALRAGNAGKRMFPIPCSEFRVPNSEICHSWVSRLVNGISVIIPSGEEKPLKSFFQTQKDVNKRLIKQLLDNENQDIESGRLKKPLTDNQIKAVLESKYAVKRSRHSIAHCRKDMGIPPAKRRLSGYKYPPLSASFSMLYPLVLEDVLRNAPQNSGIYEFRVKGKEIEYLNGKTQVIYIGSTRNIKKRLREHLGKSSKNGHIRDFLKNHGCFFRFIQFSKNWKEEEGRLYGLFVSTYGAPPKCNRVRPGEVARRK
ncbi:MAG: GIY-YIG nuclease family protein [Kiritimatiellae bacterium]|nr:GIY-YIG nuclease family protein [Euryarchaeota archaeon]MCG2661401.1 GIY-YIG nuclease family protein [Kiritimatiellia bacterium]